MLSEQSRKLRLLTAGQNISYLPGGADPTVGYSTGGYVTLSQRHSNETSDMASISGICGIGGSSKRTSGESTKAWAIVPSCWDRQGHLDSPAGNGGFWVDVPASYRNSSV
jgi:hypothetical protein